MSRVPYTKEVAQLKSLSLKRKEATSTHVAITEKNICQTNHMYINKGIFLQKSHLLLTLLNRSFSVMLQL